ncbi:MAG TPA: transcription-repair coupling factor, partial [Verrucomicrobiae bacterium]|nr:transcription-repair coupling factor [Verrucomicrobiae bacterium]
MTQKTSVAAASNLFAEVSQTPAAQSLLRRLETGGALSCAGVSPAAQPFLAVLLRHVFPERPIVVVADGLKTQESFQQDIQTWLGFAESKVQGPRFKAKDASSHPPPSILHPQLFFYPAWEILPHESKLPHADIISERLETLVALSEHSALRTRHSALIVSNVAA